MKRVLTVVLFFAGSSISAQKAPTFKEVLKATTEISVTDSILINYFSFDKTALDKITGERLFKLFYPKAKPLDQGEYFVSGKITSHKDFNILLLCLESMVKDHSNEWRAPINRSVSKELFFVLLDKDGNYKNNFLVAMNFEKVNYFQKTVIRKISSLLYKDFRIVQQVEAESRPANDIILPVEKEHTKTMNFSMEYRINDYRVFVAYPKFKSN